MILYTCAASRGFRASWTAAELGLALEYRILPFPPRLFAPEYLLENPLGTVPMLVDGDLRMTESIAICEYLAALASPNALVVAPDEPEYGHFIDFLHHADATLTFPQTVYMRFALFERARGYAEAGEAYARWFGARLAKLESRLEGRQYICGDRFTLADIAIGYALWLAQLVKLDHFFQPNVAYYIERLTSRPAFIRAMEVEKAAGTGVSPTVLEAIGSFVSDGPVA